MGVVSHRVMPACLSGHCATEESGDQARAQGMGAQVDQIAKPLASSQTKRNLASQAALVVKNLPANAGDIKSCRFNPWVRKIPWNRKWQPTPVFLPGEAHGRRAWQATVHRVAESQTRLSE